MKLMSDRQFRLLIQNTRPRKCYSFKKALWNTLECPSDSESVIDGSTVAFTKVYFIHALIQHEAKRESQNKAKPPLNFNEYPNVETFLGFTIMIHPQGHLERSANILLQGNINSCNFFAPGEGCMKNYSFTGHFLFWPISLQLFFSANVSLCLATQQKCVSVASKLPAFTKLGAPE